MLNYVYVLGQYKVVSAHFLPLIRLDLSVNGTLEMHHMDSLSSKVHVMAVGPLLVKSFLCYSLIIYAHGKCEFIQLHITLLNTCIDFFIYFIACMY